MNRGASVLLSSIVLGACVSTDVDELSLSTCASPEPGPPVTRSVVQLSPLEPPHEFCNAVAIAPTLLLTAVNCVTPLLSQDEDRAGFTAPRCTTTGAPVEDGSFLFRYMMTARPSTVSLLLEDGTEFVSPINELFVSSATSICTAEIAVVQMQLALDVPPAPLRFEGSDRVGEEVVIVGSELTPNGPERLVSTASILESTFEQGSSSLPPRSLRLSGDSCAKPGAAVFAPDTGAIIGLVRTTQRTIDCSGAEERPIAVQVAPFRQFLLEVAREIPTLLVAEFGSDVVGPIPSCSKSPASPPPP